jgi:ATP-binding cassette subfamily B protein
MKKSSVLNTFRLYWQHMRARKPQLFSIVGATAVVVVADQFLSPLLLAVTFDKLSAGTTNLNFWHDFGWILLLFALIKMLATVLWRFIIWLLWGFEVEIGKELSQRCFNFVINQSVAFHSNHFAGALVSQTTKFVNAFESLFDVFAFSILTNIIAFFATTIILFPRAPLYVCVFLLLSSIYVLAVYFRTKRQQPYNNRTASAQSEMTAQLADSITNVHTIKTFAREKFEYHRFDSYTDKVRSREYDTRRITTYNDLIFSGLNNSMNWLSLFFGVFLVVNNHAKVGTLYLITTYTMNLLNRLWDLNNNMRNITRSLGNARDMTELLPIESELQDTKKPEKSKIIRGQVEFKNVGFFYPENAEDPLFEKLSLKVKPGEKVGLVGHSGGGKTTITKLLLRFMDIQNGQILIDGQNIAKIKQSDLRSRISYVSQEPILFHRTLAENIGYGDHEADQQAIEAVAKLAHAHEFISKLPRGYETLVGERGVKLSGGQRQRVAIARAMLKNAPILVLDEATSALDSESEVLIQDALWRLMENRTAIVIAHRLSTIQKMDRIIVLENGQVVEEGSHKELLAKNGTYARLWAHQSGGFIEDED